MPLFSLNDQPGFLCCDECGSINIRSVNLQHLWILPADIHGYVMPDEPKIERDDFGPITTRTVRCR